MLVGIKMEKNKLNGMTKKLQHLVKVRKTPLVVIKQGSIRYRSRNSDSESADSYDYDSSDYNT